MVSSYFRINHELIDQCRCKIDDFEVYLKQLTLEENHTIREMESNFQK
jgi:hypothetical protein